MDWFEKVNVYKDSVIVTCRVLCGNTVKDNVFNVAQTSWDSLKDKVRSTWLAILTEEIKKKN
jgi:hypothetical protein